MAAKKEPCPATKVMLPLKWVSNCEKNKGHRGKHERWSQTRKWKNTWEDGDPGASQ